MNTLRARDERKLVDEICARIGDGESLRSILKDPGMPSMSTIRRWRIADSEVEQAFILAAQDQADSFADLALEVAESARCQRSRELTHLCSRELTLSVCAR